MSDASLTFAKTDHDGGWVRKKGDGPAALWAISAFAGAANASWDSLPHIKEVALRDGEFIEFDTLASSRQPLRVTIAWTDPDGTTQPYKTLDSTNSVLLNDLDLRVLSPDGTTYLPWVLNPAVPTNAAPRGDNSLDNVEQVLIETPTNAWHTVRVTHKGSLQDGMQDVSIIVSGNTPTNAPDFRISEVGVTGSGGLVGLEWPGVVGALYAVEASTDLLLSNGWIDVESTLDTRVESTTLSWADTNTTAHAVRFYRLKRLR